MKKTTQTLLLVFSTLLLLAAVAVSAHAQTPDYFIGTWNTVTDKGEKIVISMRERGPNLIYGNFSSLHGLTGSQPVLPITGTLRGTVSGNVLPFTWRQEDGSQGAGRFTLSSDVQSFEGTFSMTQNSDDTSGGTWTGTRAPFFAGVWHAKLGEAVMELILQQSSDQVTGQLKVNSAVLGVIREGIVVENTLRFKIMRYGRVLPNGRRLPDEYVGTGELVMDKGSKSLKGNVLDTAISGTLVGR